MFREGTFRTLPVHRYPIRRFHFLQLEFIGGAGVVRQDVTLRFASQRGTKNLKSALRTCRSNSSLSFAVKRESTLRLKHPPAPHQFQNRAVQNASVEDEKHRGVLFHFDRVNNAFSLAALGAYIPAIMVLKNRYER